MNRQGYMKMWRANNKDKVRKSNQEYYSKAQNSLSYKQAKHNYYLLYRQETIDRTKTFNKKNNYMKIWRTINRDRLIQYNKQYEENHKSSLTAARKRWEQSFYGRTYLKARNAERRSKLKDLLRTTVQQVYEDNIKKYGTLTCYLCLKPVEFGQDSLEHKIPICKGGTNMRENLDIAHKRCNSRKGKKSIDEYKILQTQKGVENA